MLHKQKGLTLIEMMIALVLSLLVVATILTIFMANVKSNTENVKMVSLNQELRTVMRFVSDELKRAGYSSDPDNSDFMNDLNTGTSNCVLYSYDVQHDGVRDNSDRFGFKLESGEIKWGQNRSATTCSSGTWSSLTNGSSTTITALSIVPVAISTASSTITIDHLDISITGQVSLQPGTATRQIQESIRVRNEDAS